MRYRWKAWVAGIATVQLLLIGIEVALWPTPSEAERFATHLQEGMPTEHARTILGGRVWSGPGSMGASGYFCTFEDGSSLTLTVDGKRGSGKPYRVTSIRIYPGGPLLNRLGRTLARLIPALQE
jgi:hypothetical protein